MGSSANNSRKIIAPFTNRKSAEKTLLNRSKLGKITSTSRKCHIFTNENLTFSLIFSQFMILVRILQKINKMIPYNQFNNYFLGKLG